MNNTINNNLSNGSTGRMVNGRNGTTTGSDVTDNVSSAATMFNGNGFGGGLRTKVISSQSQISSNNVRESSERVVVKKSFIQQRVEKLYGNAEGVVINKQIYTNNSGSTNERKYLNNIANENVVANKNCYTTPASAVHLNGTATSNGSSNGNGVGVVTKENLDVNSKEFAGVGGDPDMEALPVMRHLRPEFRAQLQLYSPKKVPKTSPGRFAANGTTNGSNGLAGNLNGGNNHVAVVSNGELSHHHHASHMTNGKVTTNGTATSSSTTTSSLLSSSASIFSSSTSVATVVESNKSTTTTNKSSTSSLSSSLSATTTTIAKSTAANACDATGPTTATNQDRDQGSQNKSSNGSGLSSTAEVEAQAVTVQASVEQKVIPEQQLQQHQEVVSSTKMKLSEPCVVNGGGVDSVDNVAFIRNGSSAIKNGGHLSSLEDKENINGGATVEVLLAKVTPATTTLVKDGNHFLQVMKNEQNRLLTMAADIEREVEQCKTDGVEISEEVAGYVLVAAGKARLLCSQKMKQFEGLCHNNLNQIPGEKFQTTNEDLQGFWDMVMLQVNDVDASFVEIDSFRRNGWKKPTPVSPVPQARSTARSTKLTKRPFKTPAAASATSNGSSASDAADAKKAAAAKREAQRKQLMELKRKQKLASSQQNVEIFVPGSSSSSSSAEVSNGVATS